MYIFDLFSRIHKPLCLNFKMFIIFLLINKKMLKYGIINALFYIFKEKKINLYHFNISMIILL